VGARRIARDYDFLNANRVKGIADPVDPSDAVNLGYLQRVLANLSTSGSEGEVFPHLIKAVFLYNMNTSAILTGFTGLFPGDYVALAGQNTSSENGIYQVSQSMTLSRVSSTLGKNLVFAVQGSVFTSPTSFYSGSAVGVQLKDNPSPGLYKVVVQSPRIYGYTARVGDGVSNTYVVNHNLGTTNVVVSCYDAQNGEEVELGVKILDQNRVQVEARPAPPSNSIKVVVMSYE
jgi:hypothetical protein